LPAHWEENAVKNWKRFLIAVAIGSSASALDPGAAVRGQVLERDTTITGPRGRSIERQVEIKRGPGTIQRQVEIKRPGGTFDRQVQLQRSPGFVRGFAPGMWSRPAWIGPRPLVLAQPAPAFGFGLLAAPFLNFSFGGGGSGLGFGAGMGGPGAGGPAPFAGGPGAGAQPPPPPDRVALECQRLQSFQISHRKDAAYTLGRLGDPRATPSLVHVLKYDNFKDVRVAAAIALGEIGGSEAAVALERAAIYDHREDVKKAAATALDRLNAKASRSAAPSAHGTVPAPRAGSPFRGSRPTEGWIPEGSGAASEPSVTDGARVPPPPPTPVGPGTPSGGDN
jgi:hypothetical protein